VIRHGTVIRRLREVRRARSSAGEVTRVGPNGPSEIRESMIRVEVFRSKSTRPIDGRNEVSGRIGSHVGR
jgi:hypothetical protein